jgi:RNA polymerase sigma-70 factor, ECF subfamily
MGAKPEAPAPSPELIEWIAAARSGDESALEAVVRHYQDRIAGYVIALLGRDVADLDDLCQIIFVKMALALPRLRSPDAFEPWLFRIAANVCRDHVRRLKSQSLFVPLSRDHESIAADPPAEETRERAAALEGALATLSSAQRELIGLVRARRYSYEELAQLTNSSVRAVAGRLFRARSRLRKLFTYGGAGR